MKSSISKKVLIVGIAVGLIISVVPCKAGWILWTDECCKANEWKEPDEYSSNGMNCYCNAFISGGSSSWSSSGVSTSANLCYSRASVSGSSVSGEGGGAAYCDSWATAWACAWWRWDGPPGESTAITCSFSVDIHGSVSVDCLAHVYGDASGGCGCSSKSSGSGGTSGGNANGYGYVNCNVSGGTIASINTAVKGGEIDLPDENDYGVGWADVSLSYDVDIDGNYVTSAGISTLSVMTYIDSDTHANGSCSSEELPGYNSASVQAIADGTACGSSSASLSF